MAGRFQAPRGWFLGLRKVTTFFFCFAPFAGFRARGWRCHCGYAPWTEQKGSQGAEINLFFQVTKKKTHSDMCFEWRSIRTLHTHPSLTSLVHGLQVACRNAERSTEFPMVGMLFFGFYNACRSLSYAGKKKKKLLAPVSRRSKPHTTSRHTVLLLLLPL